MRRLSAPQARSIRGSGAAGRPEQPSRGCRGQLGAPTYVHVVSLGYRELNPACTDGHRLTGSQRSTTAWSRPAALLWDIAHDTCPQGTRAFIHFLYTN